MSFSEDLGAWAETQFWGANLSDVRRVRRLIKVGRAMAEQPGASIPELCESPYDVKATYALFRHPEATPDNLQWGHRRIVAGKLRESGVWLLAEDTSEISWAGRHAISGLGPVGSGHATAQGFLLHSVLAVRWAGEAASGSPRRPAVEVVGLADQLFHVRTPIPEGECGNGSKNRMHRERESRLWTDVSEHLGNAPEGVRWVRVCDRGADIYEFLLDCNVRGHGFVVRASQDRVLVSSNGKRAGTLFDLARSLAPWGHLALGLRERPKQPARTAKLAYTAAPVSLRSPQRPGAAPGRLAPIPCWVVRVWEPEPPEGIEALEWILLCDGPVSTPEEVVQVALQYATRWVVEDFHKALKTGLGAERLQLGTAHGLFAAIAVMSIDALRLLDLRERLRVAPDAPATESGLDPLELDILALRTRRNLATVRDVVLAIGRIGGHMNRKGDGLPGLITLWRGMKKLRNLVAGAMLGSQLNRSG